MSRFLLDTHAVLWWLASPEQLSQAARAVIEDERAQVFVSAAAFWEVSIKSGLGKLRFESDMALEVERARLLTLDITPTHGMEAGRLPMLHRDPFDRIHVAQARIEGMTIITRDPAIAAYGVRCVLA
jgi:PIN domain nuclease of toxin-antitoxin system